MNISELSELNALAIQDAKRYTRQREQCSAIAREEGRHFTAIVGPRGVGKTVILKQLAEELPRTFYVSADTVGEDDLFEVAKRLSTDLRIERLLVDEIHFQKGYDEKLKKMYDFLDLRVVFTSSVSLSLFESSYDLSRRIRLARVYPFSLREYALFRAGIETARLGLESLVQGDFDRSYLGYEYLFEPYLQGGLMPFSLEEPDVLALQKNILHTVIHRDIPRVARLAVDELPLIEKTVAFAARSGVDGVNFSSISQNVGITKYKAEQYVRLLEKAFVFNPVYPAGTNVSREPKILLCLPYRLLERAFDDAVGGLREDFFAETVRMAGDEFSYLKSTRGAKTPDFVISHAGGRLIIEVGGKGKGRRQFKGMSGEKAMVLTHPGRIGGISRPLFLLGFTV
jgi:predicted AAA+ superfamily ATPase